MHYNCNNLIHRIFTSIKSLQKLKLCYTTVRITTQNLKVKMEINFMSPTKIMPQTVGNGSPEECITV